MVPSCMVSLILGMVIRVALIPEHLLPLWEMKFYLFFWRGCPRISSDLWSLPFPQALFPFFTFCPAFFNFLQQIIYIFTFFTQNGYHSIYRHSIFFFHADVKQVCLHRRIPIPWLLYRSLLQPEYPRLYFISLLFLTIVR
jgi:hypothetical protein